MTPAELRARRRALALSQSALGEALGVTGNTIARWERGEVPIRTPELLRLALDQLTRSTHSAAPAGFLPSPSQGHSAVLHGSLRIPRKRMDRLPAQLSSFIGRERELSEARRLLESGRLVSLTGVPGAGKSRLGLELAAAVAESYRDGVCFVSLAPLRDPAMVPLAIAAALGLRDSVGRTTLEIVVDFLRSKHLLLFLDNFEHVLAALADVAPLLAQCPRLSMLVTSRSALRVSGEQELVVPPLNLPNPARLPSLEELSKCEAVRLFIERARATRQDFAITVSNAQAVAEICCRLDGFPLPLELAAARIRVLPPHALLARLNQRLLMLAERPSDRPARHQSLRGAIAWSYELLSTAEQALMRMLAVFVGGCTLQAIEDVCGPRVAGIAGQRSVLDCLTSLVDHSLLLREPLDTTDPRFGMLETIREYAWEQLVSCGEADALQEQHAMYFASLAEQAEQGLTGPDQPAWLQRLEREQDNVREVLRWSLDHGAAETALRLGSALWRFWYPRGYLREGQRWLAAALAAPGAVAAGVRAKALNAAGNLAERAGEYARATTLFEESLELGRRLGDARGAAQAISNLALVAQARGDDARAIVLYETGLTAWRELGGLRPLATALNNFGLLLRCRGELDRATALLSESLALYRELRDGRGTSLALLNLARIARDRGEYRQGEALATESIAFWRDIGDRWGIAASLEVFAQAAFEQGELRRAAQLFGTAQALYQTIGTQPATDRLLDVRRAVEAVRAALGENAFLVAQAEGAALSLDESVARARRAEPPDASRPVPPNTTDGGRDDVLRMDPQTFTVWVGERELERRLSVQEFRLLHHLYEHCERVCARQELGDAIWGTSLWEPNMLHRLVHRLKRKVEPNPRQARYVQSVAWIGYRLTP